MSGLLLHLQRVADLLVGADGLPATDVDCICSVVIG